jgi:hypothetical protein
MIYYKITRAVNKIQIHKTLTYISLVTSGPFFKILALLQDNFICYLINEKTMFSYLRTQIVKCTTLWFHVLTVVYREKQAKTKSCVNTLSPSKRKLLFNIDISKGSILYNLFFCAANSLACLWCAYLILNNYKFKSRLLLNLRAIYIEKEVNKNQFLYNKATHIIFISLNI